MEYIQGFMILLKFGWIRKLTPMLKCFASFLKEAGFGAASQGFKPEIIRFLKEFDLSENVVMDRK